MDRSERKRCTPLSQLKRESILLFFVSVSQSLTTPLRYIRPTLVLLILLYTQYPSYLTSCIKDGRETRRETTSRRTETERSTKRKQCETIEQAGEQKKHHIIKEEETKPRIKKHAWRLQCERSLPIETRRDFSVELIRVSPIKLKRNKF